MSFVTRLHALGLSLRGLALSQALGLALMMAVIAVAGPAQASGQRVALVIGNSAYTDLDKLRNATNDANDIAAALRGIGYEVVTGSDLTVSGFKQVTRDFLDKLRGSDTALFYYAGHGIQVDNTNYMLPVDAQLKSITDIVFDAIPVQEIIRLMEQEARTTVVLLDSCRDNPLKGKGITNGTRGVSLFPGFAPEDGSSGTYIAFAAQPGQASLDGDGRNSPFTAAVLKHLPERGVDIRLMMADVRQEVADETDNRQVPWENSSLVGRFFLNPAAAAPEPKVAVAMPDQAEDPIAAERKAWEAIVNSTNPGDFLDFLADYPSGFFASTARSQLKRMLPAASVPAPAVAASAEPARPAAPAAAAASAPSLVVLPGEEEAPAAKAGSNVTLAEQPAGQAVPVTTPRPQEAAKSVAETLQPAKPDAAVIAPAETVAAPVARSVVAPPATEEAAAAAAQAEAPVAKPEPAKDTQVAALEPAPEPTPEQIAETAKVLARDTQQELVRLGCLSGDADGVWGRKSERAVEDYALRQKVKLASLAPDPELLTRLKTEGPRVCPLVCSARQVAKGDVCVAKTCAAGRELTASGQCRKIVKVASKPAKPVKKRARDEDDGPRYIDEDDGPDHHSSGPPPTHTGLCFKYNGIKVCN